MPAQSLAPTIAELTGSLVGDFDLIEVLTLIADACIQCCDSSAASLLLSDGQGALQVAAASDSSGSTLEVFPMRRMGGPCAESFSRNEVITSEDLAEESRREWEEFVIAALRAGFRSVHARPLRIKGHPVGSLELLGERGDQIADMDLVGAEALANVAALAILLHSGKARSDLRRNIDQALDDRAVIEQAKGMLAERTAQELTWLDTLLRTYARNTDARVADVARRVVDGSLDFLELDDGAQLP